jgi:hypothetical protein
MKRAMLMKKFGTDDRQNPQPAASAEPTRVPPPRSQLRLAATLTFAGFVVSLVAGLFHADSANANDHPATFAEYARSGIWTAVHLGQFVGMALLIAGLLVLLFVLKAPGGALAWTARFGAAAGQGPSGRRVRGQMVRGALARFSVSSAAVCRST